MILLPNSHRFESLTRFYCFSSSSASTSDARVAATDQAQVTQGSGVSARDRGLAVGSGARINTGLDARGARVQGNITVGVDQAGLEALLGQVSNATAEEIQALNEVLDKQSEQIGTLAENKQTGDDKSKNQMLTAIALVAVAGGLWAATRK